MLTCTRSLDRWRPGGVYCHESDHDRNSVFCVLALCCRDTFELKRVFSADDVETFLRLTGDGNPVHRADQSSISESTIYTACFLHSSADGQP